MMCCRKNVGSDIAQQLMMTGRALSSLPNADKSIRVTELVDFLHVIIPSSLGPPCFCSSHFGDVNAPCGIVTTGGELLVTYLETVAPPSAYDNYKRWKRAKSTGAPCLPTYTCEDKTLLKFYGWATFNGAAISRGWKRQLQVFGLGMQMMGLSRRGQDTLSAFGLGTAGRTHLRSEVADSQRQEVHARSP